jgi:3-deoxy-D-manno-octulosonate 8-phosphate phosphatase (KDO 8-P phosphatase)
MNIKLFLTDIDGVWTDGGMYYDNSGNELKRFNTSDSAGVLMLRAVNIPTGIISGEDNQIIKRRAEKLRITILHSGIRNKLACAEAIARELNINLSQIAYIGDDLNDMDLLQKVGVSAAPADAPSYVQSLVTWKLTKKGGDGVFREFAEKYLEKEGLLDQAINRLLESLRKG